MLETNVIVAPNSPNARANPKDIPVKILGIARGRLIYQKRWNALAPIDLAARRSRGGSLSKPRRKARTIKGNAIMPAASAAPRHVNAMPIPIWSKIAPSLVEGASKMSNIYPVTTGGTTSGKYTRISNRILPRKSFLASIYAIAIAGSSAKITAAVATLSESHRAEISAGSSIGYFCCISF